MNLEPSQRASNSHEISISTQQQDINACLKVVHEALLDVKAKEIVEIDVSRISNVSDAIVIASGTSTRHVKALADNVADEARKAGFRPIGVEGERDAEWILIDLGIVVVHVMLPTARKFYDLESLWRGNPESAAQV
ncbi:ribosome silencing factor [Acinetobacter pullicarnis]|uniref:ribosome silencing factor n=1 Tax=Acinetobacter pullicarnis TaxID=2576829 RepID=UPI001120BA93|nr:ribosome silencing factor [Acinetobacter pullicarnis]